MSEQCSSCDWNRVGLLKLERKYDKILQLLTLQLEELQTDMIQMQGRGAGQNE